MLNTSDQGFIIAGHAPVTQPYAIDVSKGGHDGTVSDQWMRRPADQCFPDLDALFNSKKTAYDRSFSAVYETNNIQFVTPSEIKTAEDLRKLSIGLDKVRFAGSDTVRSMEVAPTHWAFSQLCDLAKFPGKQLRELPSPIVSDVLSWRLRYAREMDEVGLYGDMLELRAATGPTYGRIPDHEVIDAIRGIAGDGLGKDPRFHWKTPGKINWSNGTYDPLDIGDGRDRTFYGSDRDMFVFLVDDQRPITIGKTRDGRDDHMFRGFYVQNSEVGRRSLKICSFYLRGVCMNRNLWGCEGFQEIRINHSRLAPSRWLETCVPALERFSHASDALFLEAVEKAKAKKIVDREEEGFAFLRSRQFSITQAREILDIHQKEEGCAPTTAWDFAQGITAYARSAPNTDKRLEIELVGKSILESAAKVSAADFGDDNEREAAFEDA